MAKIIQKIKFFFDILVKSLTKFEYYKEIKKANFKFSLKYLFSLFYVISLIGSLIFATSIGILVLPKVPTFVTVFEQKAKSLYPVGLVVNVKNGMITTNQKEPYSLDTLNQFNLGNAKKHLVTIDTSANPSDIKNENTQVLVTKDSVTVLKSDNSYQVYPIDTSANYTINQKGYEDLLAKLSPYLKYIEPAVIILILLAVLIWPIIAAFLSLVFKLIYLLIFTGVLFLVIKLMKKELPFKKLYQLAMHASTLPILLGLVVSTLGIQMPFLLGSAVLLVFMILVINHL